MIISATARAAGWTPPAKPVPTVSAKPARKGAPVKSKKGAPVRRAVTDLLLPRPTDLPAHQLAWGMPVGPKSRTRAYMERDTYGKLAARANRDDTPRVDAAGQDRSPTKPSKTDVNVAAAHVHAEAKAHGRSDYLPTFLR